MNQGAQQKIFVLEGTEVRSNSNGQYFGTTCVLTSMTKYQEIHELFMPEKHVQKLTQSVKKSLIVKGFSQKQDGTMSLNEASKIMDTTDDNVSEDIVKKFLEPEVEDVATIKTKAKGARVSIKGEVRKTTNVLETPNSRRRIINVSDDTGEIELKFWGSKSSIALQQGTHATFTCLRVDVFNGRASLNSTCSTTVKTNEEQIQVSGEVQAACFDNDDMSIMIQDHIYAISESQMGRIFPLLQFHGNVQVKILCQGNNVKEIREVSNPDEE